MKEVAQEKIAEAEIEHDQVDDGEKGEVAKRRMDTEFFLREDDERERVTDAADEETDQGERSSDARIVDVAEESDGRRFDVGSGGGG